MTQISPLSAQEALRGYDEFVHTALQQWQAPGLALAVVKDGEVILAQGYGLRDVARNLAVTPQTLFAIGSSSKAFTAMCLAMLVDEGKLDWDTPVRHYMPAFKLYDTFASERMTPRDLLIHNSGLPRHELVWYNSTLSRKEMFERLQYLMPNKDFRSTWQYQNLMYMTAGYLVEAVSGQTWEEFVQQRIFTPLGMTSSNFSVQESQRSADFALPYREVRGEVQRMEFYDRSQAVGPAGSINSNVNDMCKWLRCLLNRGKYGEDDKRLVSEEQFARLITPQIVTPDLPTLFTRYPEISTWTYAFGWFVTSYRGRTLVEHGGNIDGFSAQVTFLPDDRIGIVALTNLDGCSAPTAITYNLCDRLSGLDQLPWIERFKENEAKLKEQMEKALQEQVGERVANAPFSHPLDAYCGAFVHPGYGTFNIVHNGETLEGHYNDLVYGFEHLHYDVFQVSQERFDLRIPASFTTNLKGEIENFSIALCMEEGAAPIVFTRAPKKDS
ncbi:MAG TPA: serine hydrolase [Ktedonobacteraceae bacterium]|nr:serine hydrolase [Ktedonobacteraceae bacterium]